MNHILITGASSGLGLGFVRHYLAADPSATIHAVDRDEFPVASINTFATKQRFHFHRLDVTDPVAVAELGRQLDDNNVHLRLLIHSAGVRGLVPSVTVGEYADVACAETLDVMDVQTLMRTFEINCVGTFLLLRAAVPSLRRATAAAGGKGGNASKAVIMGSRMGSIGHVGVSGQGGAYAYRASKAALNAVVKSLSVDVPEVIWTVVHPGRVETGLVSVTEDGATVVEESIADCVRLIDTLDLRSSGEFMDRFGELIQW